jgi:superfamily II DNA or RNA helicase
MRTFKDLDPYQVYAIKRGVLSATGAEHIQTGLGKTIIALTIWDQLRKRGLSKGCLVVAPLNVVYNVWRQEAAQWAHTHALKFNIIHAGAGRGPAEVVKRRGLLTKADIWLINYEGLAWLTKAIYTFFRNKPMPFDMVVYDEHTYMKHPSTVRFRTWAQVMFSFKYRFGLTGTPMPNGYIDLYGQYFTLDAGHRLGKDITAYRAAYFTTLGHAPRVKYVPLKGSADRIKARVKDITTVLRKEDYLNLPPLKYNVIRLDLPTSVRATYDQLETELVAELDQEHIRIPNLTAAANKLRQFLSGRVYRQDGSVSDLIHTVKLDLLKEIREGLDQNVITAFNYRFEAEDLRRVRPRAKIIQGGMTSSSVSAIINGWNGGTIRDLFINPAASAYGLNLQRGGHTVLWYSLTYNLEHFIQLVDRLHRRGQEFVVMVHMMVFRGTIEEKLANVLATKGAVQTDFINTLRHVVR